MFWNGHHKSRGFSHHTHNQLPYRHPHPHRHRPVWRRGGGPCLRQGLQRGLWHAQGPGAADRGDGPAGHRGDLEQDLQRDLLDPERRASGVWRHLRHRHGPVGHQGQGLQGSRLQTAGRQKQPPPTHLRFPAAVLLGRVEREGPQLGGDGHPGGICGERAARREGGVHRPQVRPDPNRREGRVHGLCARGRPAVRRGAEPGGEPDGGDSRGGGTGHRHPHREPRADRHRRRPADGQAA